MSNRIIKDFKGWNLLTEDNDIVKPIAQSSPLNSPTPNLNFSNPIAGVTPPTPATPAKPATPKVKAAQPVPTADLKTANAAALTRNDWAAIQTELNRSGILADKAAVVTESRYKLYEALLTVDGIPGSKTLAAVKLYLDTFNANNKSGIKIGTDVPITAQSIGSDLLATLATKQVNNGSPDSQKVPVVSPNFDQRIAADDTAATQICQMIQDKFSETSFWAPFKGTFNDDEGAAGIAYNNWYVTTVVPLTKALRPGDPNITTIDTAQKTIVQKLQGGTDGDTHNWQIDTMNGPMQYTVDTDF